MNSPTLMFFVAFVVPWAAAGVFLSRWRHQIYWDKRRSSSPGLARSVLALCWALRAVPLVLLVLVTFYDAEGPPWLVRQVSLGVLFLGGILPMLCVNILIRGMQSIWEHRAKGYSMQACCVRTMAREAGQQFSGITLPLLLESVWFLKPFASVLHLVVRKCVEECDETELLPMEDGLLKQELLAIGGRFGGRPKQLLVASSSSRSRTVGCPVFASKSAKAKPGETVIHAESLFCLAPSTITAAFATDSASLVRSGSWAARHDRAKVIQLAVAAVILVAIAFLVEVWHPFQMPSSPHRRFPIGAFYGVLGAAGAVVLLVMKILGFRWSSRKAYSDAFRVWRSARPAGSGQELRRPEDFVAALAEQHSFQHAIDDPMLTIHQLRLNPDLLDFVREQGDTNLEGCLRHAARYLAERQQHWAETAEAPRRG